MFKLSYPTKILLSAVIAAVLALFIINAIQKPQEALGNIASGDAMLATTTGPYTGVGDGKLLCTGSGVLGSVIVSGPVYNSQFFLVDATTTDVVNGNAVRRATSSLVIAEVSKSVPGNATTTGAVPYNAQFRTGLIIGAFGNSLATTTITYRCFSN